METSKWHTATIVSAVLFSAFSAVHLIDDFLSGVPAEFNLTIPNTLLLSFAYMLALLGLIVGASCRSPTSYLGLAIAGLLIFLAQMLKSVPEMIKPGSWHLGLPSEIAAIGLGLSAGMTAVFSYLSWRVTRHTDRRMY